MGSVFVLVLLHKNNKLRSIYRNIKSQDEFIVRILRFFIVTLQMLRHAETACPKSKRRKGGCLAMPIHIFNIRKQHKEK